MGTVVGFLDIRSTVTVNDCFPADSVMAISLMDVD